VQRTFATFATESTVATRSTAVTFAAESAVATVTWLSRRDLGSVHALLPRKSPSCFSGLRQMSEPLRNLATATIATAVAIAIAVAAFAAFARDLHELSRYEQQWCQLEAGFRCE